MWGRDFDWYNFRPPSVTLTPQVGGGSNCAGSKLDIGIAAKRWQIEQHFVLRGIGKSLVGFRMAQLPAP